MHDVRASLDAIAVVEAGRAVDVADRIELRGLNVRGNHGVFDHERAMVRTSSSTSPCGSIWRPRPHSDDFADTFDYGVLAERAAAIVAGPATEPDRDGCRRDRRGRDDRPSGARRRGGGAQAAAPIPLTFADVAVVARRSRAVAGRGDAMSRVVLSIGSNLGDRLARLQSVVDGLGDAVRAVSPVYETDPWGGVEQGPFLNAVLIADDPALDGHGWLRCAQELEVAADRVRGERWGPRTPRRRPGHVPSTDGRELFSRDEA